MLTRDWTIDIEIEHHEFSLDSAVVRQVMVYLLQALEHEPLPESVSELSILFTDDKDIQRLNNSYRGKDAPTDVLSFSQLEGNDGFPSLCLGDLVISLDTALSQSVEYRVTIGEELIRLLIHGLLHLFGYEHEGVPCEVEKAMQDKEDELMKLVLHLEAQLELVQRR